MSNLRTEGFFQKIRGKIKETWGNLTDDDLDKTEGNVDQLVGTIKQKTGETEDSIRGRLDRWQRDDESSATTDRQSRKVQAAMNCYVCARASVHSQAVAICKNCSVGLCMLHLAETQESSPGGTVMGCTHILPAPRDVDSSLRQGEVRDLGRTLMANPKLKEIAGTQRYMPAWNGHMLWNGNYFLYIYEGAIGVKTGYTEEANSTLVAAAERDGRTLYASVFGSWDAYWDAMRLLDWAFTNTRSTCR